MNIVKGTVSVVLSIPLWKISNAWFTTVPLKNVEDNYILSD